MEPDPNQSPASVAVVIPCYNYAHFLDAAIQSVLAQTLPPDEIVVVDDGSEDNTREVCSRYESVKYVWQPNRGLPAARNTGIRCSRAQYLLFLDADDLLERTAIEQLTRGFRDVKVPIAAVVGNDLVVDTNGVPCKGARDGESIGDYVAEWPTNEFALSSRRLLYRTVKGAMIAACSTLIRREVFEAVGYWNEAYRYHEDREFWMRVLSRYAIAWTPERVAVILKHEHNITNPKNRHRNQVYLMQLLDDATHAPWADRHVRHLARCQFALRAYYHAQRLAKSGQLPEARRLMGAVLKKTPFRFKPLVRWLEYWCREKLGRFPASER